MADVVQPGQHVMAVRVESRHDDLEPMPLSGEGTDSDEGRPLIEYSRLT